MILQLDKSWAQLGDWDFRQVGCVCVCEPVSRQAQLGPGKQPVDVPASLAENILDWQEKRKGAKATSGAC